MKTIKQLYNICESFNDRNGSSVAENEQLRDFKDLIEEDLEEDVKKLDKAITLFNNNDVFENSDLYNEFYYNFLSSMANMSSYFADLHEIMFNLNKYKRYQDGEITLEEYLDDGILQIEYVDEEDE